MDSAKMTVRQESAKIKPAVYVRKKGTREKMEKNWRVPTVGIDANAVKMVIAKMDVLIISAQKTNRENVSEKKTEKKEATATAKENVR